MELRWKRTLSTILLLITITVGSFAFIGIMHSTSTTSLDGTPMPLQDFILSQCETQSQTPIDNTSSAATEEALILAREAFAQNHTQTILQCGVFRHHENTSIYYVSIYYARIFNYAEGEFHIPYRHDYIVNAQTKTVNDGVTIDIPEGFIAKFIGQKPIPSKRKATQTYFMLLDKSPSKNYYIYSVENDMLNLETTRTHRMYRVAGTFRNFAVNCIDAKITITYNIFHNGTASLESVDM